VFRRPSNLGWFSFRLTAALRAGAVVTWGVAWGCALWAPGSETVQRVAEFHGAEPNPAVTMRIPEPLRAGWTEPGFGARSFIGSRSVGLDEGGYSVMLVGGSGKSRQAHAAFGEYGLPCAALMWIEPSTDSKLRDGLEAPEWLEPRDGMSWDTTLARKARLPTRVLVLGFIANTLLATGGLIGAVAGLGLARRRLRRAKGRCVRCGYDRRGLVGACPECGAA
jgi:hypothetical protein